jgi:hypothetical protein
MCCCAAVRVREYKPAPISADPLSTVYRGLKKIRKLKK